MPLKIMKLTEATPGGQGVASVSQHNREQYVGLVQSKACSICQRCIKYLLYDVDKNCRDRRGLISFNVQFDFSIHVHVYNTQSIQIFQYSGTPAMLEVVRQAIFRLDAILTEFQPLMLQEQYSGQNVLILSMLQGISWSEHKENTPVCTGRFENFECGSRFLERVLLSLSRYKAW